MFTMQYQCPCGTAWEMTHDSHCDDRCPACDLANSPTDVRDYCTGCGCILTSHESPELCRSCERIKGEL